MSDVEYGQCPGPFHPGTLRRAHSCGVATQKIRGHVTLCLACTLEEIPKGNRRIEGIRRRAGLD